MASTSHRRWCYPRCYAHRLEQTSVAACRATACPHTPPDLQTVDGDALRARLGIGVAAHAATHFMPSRGCQGIRLLRERPRGTQRDETSKHECFHPTLPGGSIGTHHRIVPDPGDCEMNFGLVFVNHPTDAAPPASLIAGRARRSMSGVVWNRERRACRRARRRTRASLCTAASARVDFEQHERTP